MSISLLLEMAASEHPDRVAVVDGEDRLTVGELTALADGGAGVIADSGAQHVAYVGAGGLMQPLLIFASARAGVPFTPINYRLSAEGVQQLIARLPDPLVIVDGRYREAVGDVGMRIVDSEDFLAAARCAEPAAEFADAEDVAIVLFTSGTTSTPKAVELSHGNLTSYITGTVEFGVAAVTDAALICVPPYHIAGVNAAMSNLYAGRKTVYLKNFDAHEWVRLVAAEQVTTATVVPTMLDRIVTALAEESVGLPSLRNLAYGGSKVSLPLLRKALDLLPHVGFVNAYGLTETSSTVAVLTPADHREFHGHPDELVASGSARSANPCPVSKCRSAPTTARSSVRDSPVNSSCGASRCPADTPASVRCSTTKAGFPPRTSPPSTKPAICSSLAVPTTPSSAAGRTSPRRNSRTSSLNIRTCGRSPSSASRIRSGARPSSPSSCRPRVSSRTPTNCGAYARTILRGSRTPDRIVFRDELPTNATGKLLRRDIVASLTDVEVD